MVSSQFIKECAIAVGFHACGIAEASALPDFDATLQSWLSHGYNADMQYMQRNADKRGDPRLLYAGAKSVISVLVSYKPIQTVEGPFKIARYAYSVDYHLRLKQMLFELIAEIKKRYPDFSGRPFVDTAPISDKRWASAAGLGWIGRNTLLVSLQYGSFCNIGEIVTDSPVDKYDSPVENRCKGCEICVRSCPNQALHCVDGRYMLDATRCTAYNTIENRDERLPEGLHTGGYVFGCDICQEVCPHNKKAPATVEVEKEKLEKIQRLFDATEEEFDAITKETPLSRINYRQWLRNLNQGTPSRDHPFSQS
ncbi:MAG: tRNA epoxyqueuosine(34) reductase QueG [Bacteroidales bacterium]|nr:tRNA epoxyqueuosine(34) reductase QueG [Bacteroidales bacterium]